VACTSTPPSVSMLPAGSHFVTRRSVSRSLRSAVVGSANLCLAAIADVRNVGGLVLPTGAAWSPDGNAIFFGETERSSDVVLFQH
jgi:hypothetical protein